MAHLESGCWKSRGQSHNAEERRPSNHVTQTSDVEFTCGSASRGLTQGVRITGDDADVSEHLETVWQELCMSMAASYHSFVLEEERRTDLIFRRKLDIFPHEQLH